MSQAELVKGMLEILREASKPTALGSSVAAHAAHVAYHLGAIRQIAKLAK